jgi:glyoxylase-like metal-dependent hydrolase (beta-lactamase superfamily II)
VPNGHGSGGGRPTEWCKNRAVTPVHDGEPWSATTDCHRGILRISGDAPALSYRPTLAYEPLGERVWTVSDGTYRSVFVEGQKAITAFDTFYSPGAAISYRLTIDRLFPGRPIETIVYSHDHLDHTGFGADLAPEARVVAHADAAAVVAARESDGQLTVTDAWDGHRLELELGGVDVELVNPGATHGNGNVAALFRSERVLFMVDTVAAGVGYTFYPDWHLASYVPSMRRLLDLPWDRFVPGHLWPLDRAGFAQALDWWDALEEAAADADAAGVDADELTEVSAYADEHLRPTWGSLPRYEEYAVLNLMRFLLHRRTGGWGLEDLPAA